MCYPSVHCGLPASRVRSLAHLLKSEEKDDGMRFVCDWMPFTQAADNAPARIISNREGQAEGQCQASLHAGIVQSLVW